MQLAARIAVRNPTARLAIESSRPQVALSVNQSINEILNTHSETDRLFISIVTHVAWLGGLLVERRTSVSQIRGSIPGQVAAV